MTASVDGDLKDLVQIEDPAFYNDPHAIFKRLRNEAPVFLYEPLQCFVLTKYEDIRFASRTPEIFTSEQGFLLNDLRYGNTTKDLFTMPGADFLSASDPPRHRELRRMVAPGLTPRSLRGLEEPIRANTREVLDKITPGEPIDVVDDVAATLPLMTIARLFGVPDEYAASLRFWADEFLKAGAKLDREGLAEAARNTRQMVAFFDEWIVRKVGSNAQDLLATMLRKKQDNPDLTYENLHMFLSSLLTGGIETTRDFLTTSLLAFREFPKQLELFRADVEGLGRRATEECLRWVTPVHGFVRTATEDVEVRGVPIKAGQRVQLMWTAANRDEDIWDHADQFDIVRPVDEAHLAFGIGEHACLGATLARMQGRIFLEEVVTRFRSWDIAGEMVRPPSVLHNSYEHAPLVFHAN